MCAHVLREVGREALESSSADLQPAATPSQLPARESRSRQTQQPANLYMVLPDKFRTQKTKKPDVVCDTGFWLIPQNNWPGVTSAEDGPVDRSPVHRRIAHRIFGDL